MKERSSFTSYLSLNEVKGWLIIMNDNKLNLILKLSVIYLIVALILCVFAIFYTQSLKNDAEQKRLQNEIQVAQMQMPELKEPQVTAAPQNGNAAEEAIALSGDKITGNSSAALTSPGGRKVIVLDAGHGKSSSAMSADEKRAEGYEYNESRGGWGEWRHYKNGTFGEECHGSGCTETAPSGGSCWYPMGNGDRSNEPQINLNNTLAAKKYLEQMGYEVRLTRTSNEQNPSMSKRVSYCFPNNDATQQPDAAMYVCLHSNAGGGRGTSYVALEGAYRQSYIASDYVAESNRAGDVINRKVAAASGLRQNSPIGNESYLILFNKSPVPIAYLEIGFFDDSSDLSILNSSYDAIGKAVAEGVDEYLNS